MTGNSPASGRDDMDQGAGEDKDEESDENASIGEDSDEEDGFIVRSITAPANALPTTTPVKSTANLLGVSTYSDSDSDSDSDYSSKSRSPVGIRTDSQPSLATFTVAEATPATFSNLEELQHGNGSLTPNSSAIEGRSRDQAVSSVAEPHLSPSRKRVRFAIPASSPKADPPATSAVTPDDADLTAHMTLFEAALGLSADGAEGANDVEEADADLAEAEDLREEAVQAELRAKVERMRERLRAARSTQTAPVQRIVERAADEEIESEGSTEELDPMRDWVEIG